MPEKINTACKCPYGCARHGNCDACQEYHRKDGSRTNCGKDGRDLAPFVNRGRRFLVTNG